MRKSASAHPHPSSTASSSSHPLASSLTDALHDADVTHSELLTLRDGLLSLPSPAPSSSSSKRKQRRTLTARLSSDVSDISTRYLQLRRLALDKLTPPHQQAHEMSTLPPSHYTASSHPSHPEPPPHYASSYQQDAVFQDTTHPLLLLPDSSQEPFSAEADAAERATFIEAIEKDVGLVHELFVDLHELVTVQGTVVDRLETAMVRTHESTRQGVDEIYKAEGYAKARRRRVCCLWMTVGMLALCIILVLYIIR